MGGSSRWGSALAVALLLLAAGEARAGKYAVAQCGWYVGADANWADTTGGAKFRPDGYCALVSQELAVAPRLLAGRSRSASRWPGSPPEAARGGTRGALGSPGAAPGANTYAGPGGAPSGAGTMAVGSRLTTFQPLGFSCPPSFVLTSWYSPARFPFCFFR